MSDVALTNSKRRFEKRAFTPLVLPAPTDRQPAAALNLAAQVRALMISDGEFTELHRRINSATQLGALNAMQGLATAVSAVGVLSAASSLAGISAADLSAVSKVLGTIRTGAANTLATALRALDQLYTTAAAAHPDGSQRTPASRPPAFGASTARTSVARAVRPRAAAARAAGRNQTAALMPVAARSVALHMPAAVLAAPRPAQLALASTLVQRQAPGTISRLLSIAVGSQLAERAPSVLAWAVTNQADRLRPLLDLAGPYAGSSGGAPATIVTALTNLTRLSLLTQLFNESLTQRPLQPIGLLHLERLEMTPLGVERGELAYSLPLAPNEKVTLAHREWSVREEQFSEFIEDYMENYSEQGVAQTDDIAMSTSTQTSHDTALSMSQPVASAAGVHVTSPVDTTKSAGSSVSDTTTKEESKAQSRTVTAFASTRTMKDHKISFTVTTVSGMEDFTAHLIENKNDDKSMRIDYFKRVRKWQSDLYRYGVRLTYDVVLPDPGAQLRRREVELQSIAKELAGEFHLDLLPSQIQVDNWEQLADQYGVVLPAPPDQVQQIETTQQVTYATPYDVNTAGDGSKWNAWDRAITLNVTVPQNYQLENLNVFAALGMWSVSSSSQWLNAYAGQSIALANADSNGYCNLDWNLDSTQVPAEGQINVVFVSQAAGTGTLQLTATVVPTESVMEEWRLACWSAIRDAAAGAAAQHRNYLRDRQTALQKAIAADDPVRLRRMEREAIMRAVLEWLFPGFEDASSVLASLPSPGSLDAGSWQQVMEYGEYIKFVQTAIDWDNVMVFLYPYFWDTIWHEEEKLFLDHPDSIHREFLRAGAARVIIPVQPGFEEQVVSLLDQGQLGSLRDQSRFAKVVKDVQDANAEYAQTTQGGGPSEDPKQPGVLIGSWTDYTPTSALDIAVILQSVFTA